MSDLQLDSFNSNRSEQKCRYRYAHLPKQLTTNMHHHHLHHHQLLYPLAAIDVQRLERSQSVCSLQTGLRNRFEKNGKKATTTSSPPSWVLKGLQQQQQQQQYQSLQMLDQKQWSHQPWPRPSSPSPSLPATLPTSSYVGSCRNGSRNVVGGSQIIAQLERDTLHRDIRRNSLSSRRGTRNFVINPLYNE